MKYESPMAKELQRYYVLWRESNAVYEEWAKTQGLSANALMILYSFYEEEETCTQKLISQKWLIPKQTVHVILKDFEAKGYIRMVPVPSDKRNKQIRLTESGRAFTSGIVEKLYRLELYVTEQMGMANMKEMNDQLERYVRLFRQGGDGDV